MLLDAYIVNSFTEEFASGNPAGVIIYGEDLPESTMQKLAFDINKSETAFVRKTKEKDSYAIRWFSPLKEVALCGHATLAAAKGIFENCVHDTIKFLYVNGVLSVKHNDDNTFIMDFPLDDYESIQIDPVYQSFFKTIKIKQCIFGKRTKKVILVLDDNSIPEDIEPDFIKMAEYEGLCGNGLGITKRSQRYDFESRYFNPWYGVNEDPVTGSVHTVLASFWGNILGKDTMKAYQASQRPGELSLKIVNTTVKIMGKAKIVMKGTIEIE